MACRSLCCFSLWWLFSPLRQRAESIEHTLMQPSDVCVGERYGGRKGCRCNVSEDMEMWLVCKEWMVCMCARNARLRMHRGGVVLGNDTGYAPEGAE